MAEPEAESMKIEREGKHRPLPEKAKAAASELDREVSGEYEAKQERDAGKKRRR